MGQTKLPFKWPDIECWLGSFVIFQGIRTTIAKKSYIFVIFKGVGGPDCLSPPPLDPLMNKVKGSKEVNEYDICEMECTADGNIIFY